MRKFILLFISFAFLSSLLTISFGARSVQAAEDEPVNAKDAICAGLLGAAGEECGDNADEDSNKVGSTIETVINILSLIGAVIAVIMLIVGGIRYVTSSGDSGSTASARNTIIYALVGLVIIALAQVIVRYVVSTVSKDPPVQQSVPANPNAGQNQN